MLAYKKNLYTTYFVKLNVFSIKLTFFMKKQKIHNPRIELGPVGVTAKHANHYATQTTF